MIQNDMGLICYIETIMSICCCVCCQTLGLPQLDGGLADIVPPLARRQQAAASCHEDLDFPFGSSAVKESISRRFHFLSVATVTIWADVAALSDEPSSCLLCGLKGVDPWITSVGLLILPTPPMPYPRNCLARIAVSFSSSSSRFLTSSTDRLLLGLRSPVIPLSTRDFDFDLDAIDTLRTAASLPCTQTR